MNMFHIYSSSVQFQTNLQEFERLKHQPPEIKTRQNETAFQLDKLEQYGRRENLELHAIPPKLNESTNEIVKHVLASLLKVHLDDSHISIFHRLPKEKLQTMIKFTITTQKYTPYYCSF